MSLAVTGRARPRGARVVAPHVPVLAALLLCLARAGATRAQLGPSAERGSQAGRTAPPSSTTEPGASAGDAIVGGVDITVVGTSADLQRLRRVVGSRTMPNGVARWTRVPRFDPKGILRGDRDSQTATLRCWIDMVDSRRVRLYFVARSGQQFLVRDVELSAAFDEVDREALSQVIELSISALLENERAGLTRAQAEALLASRELPAPARPTPTPASPAPAPTPTAPPAVLTTGASPVAEAAGPPLAVTSGPAAGVFYRGQALGTDLPLVHGPGVVLASGGVAMQGRLGGWVSAQYQLPVEEVGREIGVRLQTVALRAGPEVHRPAVGDVRARGRGLSLAGVTGRAGLGVDLVRVTPRPGSGDASAALTPARWSQSVVLTAAAGVSWTAGPHMGLGLFLAVDLLPKAVNYDLNSGGQTAAAFSPWRARPGLSLELSFR